METPSQTTTTSDGEAVAAFHLVNSVAPPVILDRAKFKPANSVEKSTL